MRIAPLCFLLALSLATLGCALSLDAAPAATPSPKTSELVLSERSVQPGYPAITVVRQVWRNTYGVSGSSIDEIRASLKRNGPGDHREDGHFDALSEWAMHWSFRYDRSDGICSLASATIEIQIIVTLPELAGPALPELNTRWQAYRTALDAHEQTHVSTQLEAANVLADEFREAASAADCTELGATLAAIGEARIRATNEADAAYDSATEHGRTQGAILQ